ncbi:Uma2 family endonuclease [Leptolyngbya sp. FACHB-261]|uniref:Uma2 family endonuclease n=1 Tax=Leptolyngbya sp. FACHB-261 TaxID=2692806 RepID=UPI001F5546B9|nr:Uma2 family endonuclease [Leptolyngbya sp. FACHB-261]
MATGHRIEVLSASTEGFDRGEKLADYRQLDSLQEYVPISSEKQRVECFRRNAASD